MNKSNETINGLRFQKYDDGYVHVHDDSNGVKFELDADEFKEEFEEAMEDLEEDDGVAKIKGSKNNLYLCKDGRNFHAFVGTNTSIKTKLKTFVKSL